tara:strand:- start:56 stop:355 length:300 start_codon:yes stop_codon:yes gene_type:complete
MEKEIKKLEVDVLFNRNAITPTIPNKIAKIKDYLSINAAQYYNSIKFCGGYEVKDQTQSVANFVIFTEDPEKVRLKFISVFSDQSVYMSIDNKIPVLQK